MGGSASGHSIEIVTGHDLAELLPLMRSYCEFYETNPSDEALLALARTLAADRLLEGVQLLARDRDGAAVGFATVFWSWDTTEAIRIGIMNDLYVAPVARGTGVADDLVRACLERCRERGAGRLEWETAPGNALARALYERLGGVREPWIVYTLGVDDPEIAGSG